MRQTKPVSSDREGRSLTRSYTVHRTRDAASWSRPTMIFLAHLLLMYNIWGRQ